MKDVRHDGIDRCWFLLLAVFVLVCWKMTPACAEQHATKVPAQDARNANIITVNTHLPLPQCASLKEWEARKALLRNQILVSAGLSPMPNKSPLHPQIFGKI